MWTAEIPPLVWVTAEMGVGFFPVSEALPITTHLICDSWSYMCERAMCFTNNKGVVHTKE